MNKTGRIIEHMKDENDFQNPENMTLQNQDGYFLDRNLMMIWELLKSDPFLPHRNSDNLFCEIIESTWF